MSKYYIEPSLDNMKVGQTYASKISRDEWTVTAINGSNMKLYKVNEPQETIEFTKHETLHYLDLVVNACPYHE